MKRSVKLFSLLVVLFFLKISVVTAQSAEPWTTKDLIEPYDLAAMIENKDSKFVIFNIGPLDNIKGAKTIGSTSSKANLEKLSKALESIPVNKTVVMYCGCCPFRSCPNIRPAFKMLKEKGYKNPKLLNLSQNLKVDWINYGYPME